MAVNIYHDSLPNVIQSGILQSRENTVAGPGTVARQGPHGAAIVTPPAEQGRRTMSIQSGVPFVIAAATVTSGMVTQGQAGVAVSWWTPFFGPAVTLMSGIVAYAVSHTVLKSKQDALESRLDRLEPKLDDIANRLSRMEGKLST